MSSFYVKHENRDIYCDLAVDRFTDRLTDEIESIKGRWELTIGGNQDYVQDFKKWKFPNPYEWQLRFETTLTEDQQQLFLEVMKYLLVHPEIVKNAAQDLWSEWEEQVVSEIDHLNALLVSEKKDFSQFLEK